MSFKDIQHLSNIYLYCGGMPTNRRTITGKPFIGLDRHNKPPRFHIHHNLLNKFKLNDNMVDIIQSEDVFEHLEYSQLKNVFNEIHRVLKPNGLFRLSMPDYDCDILYNRSTKDKHGNIIFDAGGGGSYNLMTRKVENGGHLWFPTYTSVKSLLEITNFPNNKIRYLHYYDETKKPVVNNIDYSMGYISRTPDNDKRVQNPRRPMSIVVDCYK
jgi:SAM-dependent methyltransferase